MVKMSEEKKKYEVSNDISEHGNSRFDITCPFCNRTVTAHKLSIAGCGKKCSCGAIHSWKGYTTKVKAND